MRRLCWLIVFACAGVVFTHAQDDKALLEKVIKDDSDVVSIIALYDDALRTQLFVAASAGELAARLGDAQKQSNEHFKKAVSPYSREEQTKIWNLTRYERLIGTLNAVPVKDKAAIEAAVSTYPEDVRSDAIDIAMRHPEVLASVDVVRSEFDRTSTALLAGYPSTVQTAYRELMKNPSALTLLNDNMRTTVLLGDLYKRNPEMVSERFRSLNIELVNRKAQDLEEWKAQMEKNPAAQSELQQSARDFANEQGYNAQEYTTPRAPITERIVYVPYPLWSGYPSWYVTPCWYPYPYWYHWGFYFWNGRPVWLSAPSWYFIYWHFHRHPHFALYPHLTNCYFDYFSYGPRRYYARSSFEARRWMTENRSRFPADFQQNQSQRIDRIRVFNPVAVDKLRPASPLPDGRRLPNDPIRPTIPQSQPNPSWGRKRSDIPTDRGNTPSDPGRPQPNPNPRPVEPTPRSVPRQEQPHNNPESPRQTPTRPPTAPRPQPTPRAVPTPRTHSPAKAPSVPSTAPRIQR